jgi:hypothetical protein
LVPLIASDDISISPAAPLSREFWLVSGAPRW